MIKVIAYILFTVLSIVLKYRFKYINDQLFLTQHHIFIKRGVMLIDPSTRPLFHSMITI